MKIIFEKIFWSYAFLLVGLAYVFGLFIDLTGDSGLYAAISRQMVDSGDWLNLKINGESYDQKPHLLFWLAGMGIKIFGNTNFAFKIFPALVGVAGIYFTYRLGKLLYSEKVGKTAALITGTSQIFVLYFFDIHTDTILQSCVIFALWQLAAHLKTGKVAHLFFGFFGVGLAMLSKGPVGAVVPFFFVLIYLLVSKKYREFFKLKWFFGILIILLVLLPTLIHLYQNFGFKGIRFYFITNNFGRISGEYAGSSTDPFFYLHTLLWAFIPWTIFVVSALYSEVKSWFSKYKNEIWGVSILGSIIIFTVVLSIAKGKAPNYFLLVIPAISVLVGKWIEVLYNQKDNKTKVLFAAHYTLLAIMAVLFITIVFLFPDEKLWLPLLLIGLEILFFLGTFRKIQKLNFENLRLYTTVIAGTFFLFMNTSVIPGLFKYQGARQVLQIYESKKTSGEILYNFELEEYELFFMAEDKVVQVKDWNELYKTMEKSGTWLYTNEIKYNDIIKMDYDIDTVYTIKQRGMNNLNLQFLNPGTRWEALENNYLIKTK